MTVAVLNAFVATDTCDDTYGALRNAGIRVKRLFILGCPRSGTTWTALLLAQHPEIQACQQIGAISSLHKFHLLWERGEVHTRYHSSAIQFGADAATPTYVPLLTRAAMIQICRNLLDDVYAHAEALHPGCKAIVDSTPENVLMPALMAELMPDAHYLQVIRDPRSVFASHRNATEDFGARFPTTPESSVNLWKQCITKGRELGTLVKNYREIRYDRLKKNGPAELQAILEWLGVTADPAWCEAVIAKTTVEKLKATKGTPKSFFRAGSATGWEKELTTNELHEVEFFARDLMTEIGFEPAHPKSDRKSGRMVFRESVHGVARPVKNSARRLLRLLSV